MLSILYTVFCLKSPENCTKLTIKRMSSVGEPGSPPITESAVLCTLKLSCTILKLSCTVFLLAEMFSLIAKPSRISYNVEGPVLPDLKNVASVTWKFLLILLDLKTYWSFLVIVKRHPDPTCGV